MHAAWSGATLHGHRQGQRVHVQRALQVIARQQRARRQQASVHCAHNKTNKTKIPKTTNNEQRRVSKHAKALRYSLPNGASCNERAPNQHKSNCEGACASDAGMSESAAVASW